MNDKKHYLIYQTTNLVNNKIYIGQHITTNIEDNYFGSGNLIKRAIQKYGLENFEFKILFELQNKEEMNLLEKYVVNREFCDRDDTYNINIGGTGGWSHLNSINSSYKKGSLKRHNAACLANKNRDLIHQANKCREIAKKRKENKNEYESYCNKISIGVKKHKQEYPEFMVKENNPMYGKKHTKKSKQKMSNYAKEHNSMHGKIWICNYELEESKIWNINESIPKGWVKGRHSKQSFKKIKEMQQEKEKQQKYKIQEKRNKLELLYAMYEEFKKNEFEGVVKKFGYMHTRNNLIMAFKANMPEYVPQKCNRWKNQK